MQTPASHHLGARGAPSRSLLCPRRGSNTPGQAKRYRLHGNRKTALIGERKARPPDGWSGSAGARRGEFSGAGTPQAAAHGSGRQSRTRTSVEHALEEKCFGGQAHRQPIRGCSNAALGIDREAPTRGSRRHHRPHTADGDMEGGDETMTRLDHGVGEPHLRRSGVACSISEPSLRARLAGGVGRQGSPVDERWVQGSPGTGDRPASASAPGISSRHSVAEGVKSASAGRTSAAVLGSDPVDSVAEWLKSAPTGPGLGRRTPGRFSPLRR